MTRRLGRCNYCGAVKDTATMAETNDTVKRYSVRKERVITRPALACEDCAK